MEETPNTQTPEEEQVEAPEATQQGSETPIEGAGTEGTVETTPTGNEFSPEKRVKELERDYSASSKEAKRLAEENKLLRTKLEGNTSGKAPSDEEAAKVVPDWDLLSPTEQGLWKEQVMLKRQVAKLSTIITQTAKDASRDKQFAELAKDPVYLELSEKKDEFIEFCQGQEPSEILAKAFLFDKAKELGAKEEKERKRPGLESGSGGTKTPLPSQELTDEQRENLRVNNSKEYARLIRTGKIKV